MATIHDISGFQVFSGSEIGRAHVTAHRMLDLDRLERGHTLLGAWLDGRHGEGSDWVHIQWHMLVFELGVGDWENAYERFTEHVLPAGRDTDEAVTDAPAGLWRLALTAPSAVALPWSAVAAPARARVLTERTPYETLHDLLALAGPRDAEAIGRWVGNAEKNPGCDETLLGFGHAFLALALGDLQTTVSRLERVLPRVSTLGGSRAQNTLFEDIHRFARGPAPHSNVALAA